MFDRRKCAAEERTRREARRRREMAIASLLAHTTILESAEGLRDLRVYDAQVASRSRICRFVRREARQRILDAASEKLRAGTLQAALVLSAIAGDKSAACEPSRGSKVDSRKRGFAAWFERHRQ